MFLTLLNKDLQTKFLNLAFMAAQANGEFDDIEKDLIASMAAEMNIESDVADSCDEEALLSDIVSCSSAAERKIMLFEIIAILHSDETLEDDETRFLYRVAAAFEVDDETVSQMITYVSDYKRLYVDICDLLLR